LILDPLSSVYGAVASWRRRWYSRHPERRRRLVRPVISVGNLCAGGSGKTPVVACLARWLTARGERPVILSRGYARQSADEPITIVSDRRAVLAPLARAGDEPLWLARALPGVPVVVGVDRYQSGMVAMSRFDPSVFLLDDGFQHLGLERDVDLLLVSDDDLRDRPLPIGRLREPLSAARAADTVVAASGGAQAMDRLSRALGVPVRFHVTRTIADAVRVADGERLPPTRTARVIAVAGIARPARFFDDLTNAGWPVVERMPYADHHPFDAADAAHIGSRAAAVQATLMLTTEKDAVRLEGLSFGALALAQVPLHVAIEPAAELDAWLSGCLRAARAGAGAPSGAAMPQGQA
jgi:tetraacyldisaccharide 4'-kinase